MALSYSQGIGTTPLLGETIGANFDRAVAAFPDRDALISRHQGVRLTYGELGENVDGTARALASLGPGQGRPRRHLGAQLRRVGSRPVRDREARRDPRQHQPRLPDDGAGLRAAPVRLQGR